MTLSGQAENRDKIVRKNGKKSLAKKQNRKVSEWEREKDRIFINSTHIQKQFDAFYSGKRYFFTVNQKWSLYVIRPKGCGKTTCFEC